MLRHYCTDVTLNNVEELFGLPLLPIASPSRECEIFGPSSGTIFYVCPEKEYNLFSKFEAMAGRLVSDQFPPDLVAVMLKVDGITTLFHYHVLVS